jgi:hypothetical protein
MTGPCFVDADVFVYTRDARDAGKQERAMQWIDALWRDRLGRARDIELRYKISWWDSMIVAAAQLQDCVLLLTEDLQDGSAFGAVTVPSTPLNEVGLQYTALAGDPGG